MIQHLMGTIALDRQRQLLRDADQERLASLARAHRHDRIDTTTSGGSARRSTKSRWLGTAGRPVASPATRQG